MKRFEPGSPRSVNAHRTIRPHHIERVRAVLVVADVQRHAALQVAFFAHVVPVRVGPGRVVDQRELEQRAEHERQAHARPHVDGLGVGHGRQRRVDAGRLRGHRQQRGDAQRDARRHRALVQPERHPRHDDQHAARDVDLDQVVTELALEQQVHLQAAVLACERTTKKTLVTPAPRTAEQLIII